MKRLLCHWRIDAEEATRAREARRLHLLALASRGLGFEPWLWPPAADAPTSIYGELALLTGRFAGYAQGTFSDDIMLCACNPGDVPCRVIYTNPTMNAEKDVEAAKFADVMLSRCRGRRDYYRDPGKHIVDISAEHQLHVPHVPHDGVLRQLEADGLIDALLTNDLEAIRAAYPADGPPIDVGFIGQDIAGRSELVPPRIADGWHIEYMTPGSPERRAPADYLRWLSRCKFVLDLPGERYVTYRFSEAVIMGTLAVIHSRPASIGSPIGKYSGHLLCDSKPDWNNFTPTARLRGDTQTKDFRYAQAWSFRGQMRRALEYIGEL